MIKVYHMNRDGTWDVYELEIDCLLTDSFIDDKKTRNEITGFRSANEVLALVFWELTSCSSPFDYETKKNDYEIILEINDGKRENPMLSTNSKFVALYQKCWKCEPDKRPDICEVISVLNGIDPIKSENNKLQTNFNPKENEKGASTEEFEETCPIMI
ncbi:kinase-like domain-containing protein [Rhizophagus irregularis DAOM 181602=DAOM 197198]|nr:kinase-like domain-containing protein [Rhizophagus irregularis DAOM 181602=DAOM 197198]